MSDHFALRMLALLLEDPEVQDKLTDLVDDAREKAPRVRDEDNVPIDRSSAEVVAEMTATVKRIAQQD